MNLYNKAYSNCQCNKNREASRLTKNYSYNEAHSNYQCNKNKDSSNYSYTCAEWFFIFISHIHYLILTII